MVFYFWLGPQVLWNDLRAIVMALTNVLRYHICRWSHPEDRQLPITELKWGSKLPAVQPLWLNFRPLPVSRIARHTCIIPQNVCTCLWLINIYSKTAITEVKWDAMTLTEIPGNTAYWFFAFFWLTEGSRNKNLTYILSRYDTSKRLSMPLLDNYSP
jgi:hypothetical protein